MRRSHVAITVLGLTSMLLCGCPLATPPDDGLEPNNTQETATVLEMGVPVTARAVQADPDVFRVAAGPDELLTFTLESLGGDDCPAFTVVGPGNSLLFSDLHGFCGDRSLTPPTIGAGSELTTEAEGDYELRIPADAEGDYYLTILELGEVDNVFDFAWDYRLTATVSPAP